MRTLVIIACSWIAAGSAHAQGLDAGRAEFENRCAKCHGGDGNGGELGPAIVLRLPGRNDQDVAALLRSGIPNAGMPAFNLSGTETQQLISYLRSLRPRAGTVGPAQATIQTVDGRTLSGVALNRTAEEMQLLSGGRVYLLRKEAGGYRQVTSQTDWPTYNGSPTGNRYSKLEQIAKNNVSRLGMKWIFTMPNPLRLEGTPIVVDGIMYVTNSNECYALDAGSGRQIWQYQRPRTKGLIGNAAGGINRGVGIAGERLFMVTDNAHLLALNRFTGALLWDTEMADWRQNYNATAAPLVVRDTVVSGTAGGEEGVRGFVSAYDQATGKELWRFWTVPKRGEPGSETWVGKALDHPGAVTWQIGSYDSELDTVYWPTGNPGPDYNGDDRLGDNLYASSVVALDAKTGKMKWYFQFTPHNVWDWDAQQPQVLVDTDWEGQPRKLLIQASRNGFFYVLDRTDGKLLLAKPFVKKLTWASGIGADGRPMVNPNQEPTLEGTKICPSSNGAANWYSTSFNPDTGLYYVQTLEQCNVFTKRPDDWQAGRPYTGGASSIAPGEVGQKILRAIDIKTGRIAWELPQSGAAASRGGTLTTASGLVFFGEDSDALMAVDGLTGKPLWRFQTNFPWRASPMTYMFEGKQYVAIASGPNILAFALPE
ncbi:MAG TPA: PQQ-dependent dehydrogenase, methanol/ethanol family [Bryobacteraceae bacterium]